MIGITIDDVSVSYDGVAALKELTFEVPGGSWIGLIGPNGAGKSTMLRAMGGLIAYTGRVRFGDEEASGLGRRRLARLVAFVPQRPATPSDMTVTDYVLMGRTPYVSYFGTESRTDVEVVSEVLARLELESVAERTLDSLSGGELQRCVLARALAQEAPVLLLDEPTAALDVGHQQQVLELVDSLRVDRELTVVTAMHDLTLAGQFADCLLLLNEGRAIASGVARTVLTEAAIRTYYGASVRVLEGPGGEVLVTPTRAARRGIER
ncbi:MAG: ABC transporter ATP-binding protein [Actinomycetota bacterium]